MRWHLLDLINRAKLLTSLACITIELWRSWWQLVHRSYLSRHRNKVHELGMKLPHEWQNAALPISGSPLFLHFTSSEINVPSPRYETVFFMNEKLHLSSKISNDRTQPSSSFIRYSSSQIHKKEFEFFLNKHNSHWIIDVHFKLAFISNAEIVNKKIVFFIMLWFFLFARQFVSRIFALWDRMYHVKIR